MRWFSALLLLLMGCGEDGLQPINDLGTAADAPIGESPDAPRAGSGPGLGGAFPIDVDTIDAACADGTETRELRIRFEDPARACDWAKDGNVSMIDGYITARREQSVPLDLPPGALLCNVDFQFERQNFWYDDHFLLNLDGVTLTASFDFSDWLETNGVWIWDWRAIRGIQWHSLDTPLDDTYCPGSDSGLSRCRFPETDTNGTIELEVADELIRSIMALNLGRNRHEMTFITTGDDNPPTDCQHDPVELTLVIQYAN